MNKHLITIFICLLFLGKFQLVHGAGATADTNLNLTLPGVQYEGQSFHVVLNYYANPLDPYQLYWKFSSIIQSNATLTDGGEVSLSLYVDNLTVIFQGIQYRVSLAPYQNPLDTEGLYWRLNTIEVMPGEIVSVSGDTSICYSVADLMTMIPCIQNCGSDPSCLMSCLPGGVFSLAVTVENNSSSPIDFTIPPGTTFLPADAGVQPMMFIEEPAETIPANSTATFCISTYCMASSLSAPGDSDSYSQDGVVGTGCLLDILNAAVGKDLTSTEVFTLQNIIWECTEEGSISSDNQLILQSM